ncbi:MAG: ATP-dependent DNA helicase RecG, partial [Chitinophagaceae bacterium]
MANPIEYLKGVGPQKADLLKKELGIFTFSDLLHHFPYRHVDKTRFSAIIDLTPANEYVQVRGILTYKETTGEKQGRRLLAYLRDETGTIELTWFKGLTWIEKTLREGERYT